MSLMLVAIFAAVGVGMIARDFGPRASTLSVAIAVLLAVTYFVRPHYMT
jgi:hypothetical protein